MEKCIAQFLYKESFHAADYSPPFRKLRIVVFGRGMEWEGRTQENYVYMGQHISCNQNMYLNVLVSDKDSYNTVNNFALDVGVYH